MVRFGLLKNQKKTEKTPYHGLISVRFFKIMNIKIAMPRSVGIKKNSFVNTIHDGKLEYPKYKGITPK